MLDERGIDYRYREYKKEPLSRAELEALLAKLGVSPAQILRRQDKAAKALGLGPESDADTLLDAMAAHPTLVQRPIGVRGERAVVGRPAERLLTLVEDA